jgi:hypothetical protein
MEWCCMIIEAMIGCVVAVVILAVWFSDDWKE